MQAIAAEATQALLADGHDGAQDRREVATLADQNLLPDEKKVSVAYMGLIHKASRGPHYWRHRRGDRIGAQLLRCMSPELAQAV
jgi:hypothetical protein